MKKSWGFSKLLMAVESALVLYSTVMGFRLASMAVSQVGVEYHEGFAGGLLC